MPPREKSIGKKLRKPQEQRMIDLDVEKKKSSGGELPNTQPKNRKGADSSNDIFYDDRFGLIDLDIDEKGLKEALGKPAPSFTGERAIDLEDQKPYTEDASDKTQPQAAAALQATPTPSPEKSGIQAFIRPERRAALQAEAQQNEGLRLFTERIRLLEEKVKAGTALTKEDLIFLYGIAESEQPPKETTLNQRIQELRRSRDVNADICAIFECTPDQIAHSPAEIKEDTKVYVGPVARTRKGMLGLGKEGLSPEYRGIFKKLAHIEHIYLQFPERRLNTTMTVGGKTKEQLEAELQAHNMQISPEAQRVMNQTAFTTTPEPQSVSIGELTVGDLAFTDYCTTQELDARTQEVGIEYCDAEVGPHYRLQHPNQPPGEYRSVWMKPIVSSGVPRVFRIYHDHGERWLNTNYAFPEYIWYPAYKLVVSLRKSN